MRRCNLRVPRRDRFGRALSGFVEMPQVLTRLASPTTGVDEV